MIRSFSIYFLAILFLPFIARGQNSISGLIIDSNSIQPIEGATIGLLRAKLSTVTSADGRFMFKQSVYADDSISVSCIGFNIAIISTKSLVNNHTISLSPKNVELNTISLSSHTTDPYKIISRTDIAMRGVTNSQEVLRIVPGIVIGQHQGGGKAEQIFLRGFDADHGTDFRMDVDGLPINLVSHAHGQGFADSHFIIPETLASVDFKKGPYTAGKGDFTTTGFVDFKTRNTLDKNIVKVEGAEFNTFRALAMISLLTNKATGKETWYVASEYRYSDGYFESPQHFNRFNLFTKYTNKLSSNNTLILSATTFWSKWNASGQIPDRAVENGTIGYYGAIDNNEGGLTYRTNVNAELVTSMPGGGTVKNQLYYSNYHFDLHTNFTFFLIDTVNGDEIRQSESRDLLGYNGSYNRSGYLGHINVSTEAGLNVRADLTSNSELSHTKDRYTTLAQLKLGNISELNIAPYLSETFKFNERFSINAGLRYDHFYHAYYNKLASDSSLNGIGLYNARASTLSPKLNLYYRINEHFQLYLASGKGFHSNDTRAVIAQNGVEVLPSAYGVDLGTIFKPINKVLINASIWTIDLDQEFVYGGDGGSVDFNGRTRRHGIDFSGRYQYSKSLYFDLDVDYAHGRAMGVAKGQDYIPLAPIWTSSGGISYLNKNGLNGSIRYRYVGDRPANSDYTLTAKGYFITDAVLNYSKTTYAIGIVINNILDTKWKETQFATESRLKGEAHPVDEIHFTPGTPFSARATLSIFF